MRVIMCQAQFAPKILDGTKRHTIRGAAKCKPGDVLSLRCWRGKPYRSKQVEFARLACTAVQKITIVDRPISTNAEGLERHVLATGDGFACYQDLLDWFSGTHGLPFAGELIHWDCQAAAAVGAARLALVTKGCLVPFTPPECDAWAMTLQALANCHPRARQVLGPRALLATVEWTPHASCGGVDLAVCLDDMLAAGWPAPVRLAHAAETKQGEGAP